MSFKNEREMLDSHKAQEDSLAQAAKIKAHVDSTNVLLKNYTPVGADTTKRKKIIGGATTMDLDSPKP